VECSERKKSKEPENIKIHLPSECDMSQAISETA
jgi:hypothetical protein